MAKKKIVLVEDDDVLRENYAEIIEDKGFSVEAFASREEATQHIKHALPDLVILDISLHGEHDAGFEICKELRALSSTLPIIFLTSHDSDIDKISGFRFGADDYLIKGVSWAFLIIRIETLLRRSEAWKSESQSASSTRQIERGNVMIDSDQLKVFWKNQLVDLNLTQYWIVKALIEETGKPKTFSDLMKSANIIVEPNTITAHIKHIRDRFGFIDKDFNNIKNERGKGYRWIDD